MLCGSLDGKAVWGRMDTEFLRCSLRSITVLLISDTSEQNKKVEKIKKKKGVKTMNTPYNLNTHTHTHTPGTGQTQEKTRSSHVERVK